MRSWRSVGPNAWSPSRPWPRSPPWPARSRLRGVPRLFGVQLLDGAAPPADAGADTEALPGLSSIKVSPGTANLIAGDSPSSQSFTAVGTFEDGGDARHYRRRRLDGVSAVLARHERQKGVARRGTWRLRHGDRRERRSVRDRERARHADEAGGGSRRRRRLADGVRGHERSFGRSAARLPSRRRVDAAEPPSPRDPVAARPRERRSSTFIWRALSSTSICTRRATPSVRRAGADCRPTRRPGEPSKPPCPVTIPSRSPSRARTSAAATFGTSTSRSLQVANVEPRRAPSTISTPTPPPSPTVERRRPASSATTSRGQRGGRSSAPASAPAAIRSLATARRCS